MSQKQNMAKTEGGYWDGPPPLDKFASLKPKLPVNRISPVKVKSTTQKVKGCNTTSIAAATPELVLSPKAHVSEIISNNNE